MHDNQLKAINWIKSGMNYTQGVDLLVELTRKQTFYNFFIGKDKSLPDKLAYEICKATALANHVTWKDFIREVQNGNFETVIQPTDFPEVKMPERTPGIEKNKNLQA